MWILNQIDSRSIFLANPFPLSQAVLLSLIQQLGFDLSKDTLTKLSWLRDAMLMLDPHDKVIEGYVQAVLTELLKNLEENYHQYSDTSNQASPLFKLLMLVVKSQLAA